MVETNSVQVKPNHSTELLQFYELLKSGNAVTSNAVRKVRDLLLLELTPGMEMVIACDSDGGIGPKEKDLIQVPGEVLGHFAARVPLMEILASGAVPALVVNTLAVEMEPTGSTIIAGIRDETVAAGMDAEKMVTGSTEDNVPTVQTGLGVVVIGFVTGEDFRPGKSMSDDLVICVGSPKSAPDDEVTLDDSEITDTHCVKILAGLDFVHDILPVGSKGIAHEQSELAHYAGLTLVPEEDPVIDIFKSAGPSTCVLVSVPPDTVDKVRSVVQQPVFAVGRLVENQTK